jgi:hypothetical protein
MQDLKFDPRSRAILPKTLKKRNYFRRNKKELYQFNDKFAVEQEKLDNKLH